MPESYGVTATNQPVDDILGEGFPFITQRVTLLGDSAGTLARGTVLGKITASGKYVAYAPAGTDDGRRVAALILADTVTVGATDVAALAYRTGVFNKAKLTGADAAAVTALDAKSIFIR